MARHMEPWYVRGSSTHKARLPEQRMKGKNKRGGRGLSGSAYCFSGSRPEGERIPMLRTKGRHASPCPMTKGRKWEGLGFDLARRHQGREKGAQAQAREAVVSAGAWSRGITHGEGLLFSAMLVIGASSTAPRTALLAA